MPANQEFADFMKILFIQRRIKERVCDDDNRNYWTGYEGSAQY